MDIADIPTPLSNSSLYPMLIASLMMQAYTPKTTSWFAFEYDYIVIGAGSAGSIVASRLSEDPSIRVLLLEAGPSPPPITEVPPILYFLQGSYIDWNITTTPQIYLNSRVIPYPRGKTIGGTGILNGMFNVRGNSRDYDRWAAKGCTGWSYNDVLPYFKMLEDFRVPEFFNYDYHDLHGPITIEQTSTVSASRTSIYQAAIEMGLQFLDINAETQYGFTYPNANIRDGRRCSSAKAYLVPASERSNLNILENALARKIIITYGRATGVEFEVNGEVFTVNARKEVIVSAGAVKTPQLLMLSGIGPQEHLEQFNIPVIANLPVGQNLQDHPTILQEYDAVGIVPYVTLFQDSCNIKQFIKDGTGPIGRLDGLFTYIFVTDQIPHAPFIVPDNQIYIIAGAVESTIECNPSTVNVGSIGSVTLRSTDPHDQPLVDPNFFSDPEDMRKIVEGLKFCNRLLATKALNRFQPVRRTKNDNGCEKYLNNEEKFLDCTVRNGAGTIWHAAGTTKMGDLYDSTTVVDPYLRVKGVRCLRVVDASIMPHVTNGNTNFPTMMIAEKASDMIKYSTDCF